MVTKIIEKIKEYKMLADGDRVLVALSGGVDSSVLLDALVKNAEALNITVCAAHLNHCIRGAAADADEAEVRKKCREYNIPLICEKIDVKRYASENGESTELAARNVRYDFLRRAKEELGADKIATAHNANDNLETVLFNLARGGGSAGLGGIPPIRGDIIRPLIGVSRAEIEEYASANEIEFCVDKTNDETEYSRNKLRHLVVPRLMDINSGVVENASRTAEIIRGEAAFLDELAHDELEKLRNEDDSCDRKALLSVPEALFSRVCELFAKKALEREDITLEYKHIKSIRELCSKDAPSKRIALPHGLEVVCEYEKIVFGKFREDKAPEPVVLSEGENFFGDYVITVRKYENYGKFNNSLNTFCLPCDRIQGNLVVRSRREGDEIKLKKRPSKTVKKLFIDYKVPRRDRDLIPIIADDSGVVAIPGFGIDERYTENGECGVVIIAAKRK